MASQHVDRTVEFTYPRWDSNSGNTSEVTMIEAQFTTEAPHKFEQWELESVNGMAYRKSELVEYKGGWYLPEHLKDVIHDDTT